MVRGKDKLDGVAGIRREVTYLYLFIVCAYLLISYLSGKYVYTKDFYFQSFAGQVDEAGVEHLFHLQAKWRWLGYISLPVLLFLKISLPAICLYTGLIFDNHPTKWYRIFRIAVIGEFIFLFQGITRLVYFLIFPPATIDSISKFAPFSLSSFFRSSETPGYLLYLLQTINLFEISYWLYLAFELGVLTGSGIKKGLLVVGKSYGLGLLIWMTVMVFLIIQFS